MGGWRERGALAMNTGLLRATTPGGRFGSQSALWMVVFSEVVLFKEKQIPLQSRHGKCHIPFWWQEGIRPFPGKTAVDYK